MPNPGVVPGMEGPGVRANVTVQPLGRPEVLHAETTALDGVAPVEQDLAVRLEEKEMNGRHSYDKELELRIRNLNFYVESRGVRKDLLKDITAHVRNGEVLAIVGGSGAGKTTLLDNVALEPRQGRRSGQVLLNGMELDHALFRSSCAYVAQSDACCASLTVKETLRFAASLYQGRGLGTKTSREDHVRALLEQVGLDACQDVKVGDGVLIRGVSGGQRRRVSLAVELLKKPWVLVLDEPTSGLDSKAAEAIVELLTGISVANNLATICTIHQPSSYVFQQFDRLLVLAKGQVCYFGKADEALRHFNAIGYPSPPGINPAEFMIRITNADFAEEGQVESICKAWQIICRKERPSLSGCLLCEPPAARSRAGFPKQVWKIFLRFVRSNLRNPLAFGGRCVLTCLLVAFVCVAYIGARKRDQANVLNYLWATMWVQQLPAFLCIGAVPNFAREHACYRKEVKNGLYHPLSHLSADLLVNIPIWFLLALAAILPATLILDMPVQSIPQGWLLLAAYVGFNDTFAQLCGSLKAGSAMGIMLFLMQTILNMIFNGTLLAHAEEVPWVMRWLFYVVPSKYSFRSGLKLAFEGLEFEGFEACSDPGLPVEVRAVMPCWGSGGSDIVTALAGQMFPVLDGNYTFVQDCLFVVGALVLLKLLHGVLMLRAWRHGSRARLGRITTAAANVGACAQQLKERR
ncbi:unnamed protein product [Effrenium voratum]|nr:unnamed protein product [Effrenium voratum]